MKGCGREGFPGRLDLEGSEIGGAKGDVSGDLRPWRTWGRFVGTNGTKVDEWDGSFGMGLLGGGWDGWCMEERFVLSLVLKIIASPFVLKYQARSSCD